MKENPMELGMIGLGRMGTNMVRRLCGQATIACMMRVGIAADHGGFALKEQLAELAARLGVRGRGLRRTSIEPRR